MLVADLKVASRLGTIEDAITKNLVRGAKGAEQN